MTSFFPCFLFLLSSPFHALRFFFLNKRSVVGERLCSRLPLRCLRFIALVQTTYMHTLLRQHTCSTAPPIDFLSLSSCMFHVYLIPCTVQIKNEWCLHILTSCLTIFTEPLGRLPVRIYKTPEALSEYITGQSRAQLCNWFLSFEIIGVCLHNDHEQSSVGA